MANRLNPLGLLERDLRWYGQLLTGGVRVDQGRAVVGEVGIVEVSPIVDDARSFSSPTRRRRAHRC